MSKYLYLIRNGHSLHNCLYSKNGIQAFYSSRVIDAPLTKIGINQAHQLKQEMKDKKVDLVLVSPLQRALKTANIAFHDRKVPIISKEYLREYPMGGQICNMRSNIEDMKDVYPAIDFSSIRSNKDIFWRKRGETLHNLMVRALTIEKYILQRPEKHIVVLGHESFISQFKDGPPNYTGDGVTTPERCEITSMVIHKKKVIYDEESLKSKYCFGV